MNLAADVGRHSGRATPSLHDTPHRHFEETTDRQSTYLLPITVQTNPATSGTSSPESQCATSDLPLWRNGMLRPLLQHKISASGLRSTSQSYPDNTLLTGTNRMVGRRTASQIASASAASFFWRRT